MLYTLYGLSITKTNLPSLVFFNTSIAVPSSTLPFSDSYFQTDFISAISPFSTISESEKRLTLLWNNQIKNNCYNLCWTRIRNYLLCFLILYNLIITNYYVWKLWHSDLGTLLKKIFRRRKFNYFYHTIFFNNQFIKVK